MAVALAMTWVMGGILVRIGPRLGLVDAPDGFLLKVHTAPAVPLGGVAVFAGWLLGWALVGGVAWSVVALAVVVVGLGLADDLVDLPPNIRLIAEAVIGVVAVVIAARPLQAGSALDLVFGTVLVVVAINAVNLFDGLDGLAGSAGMVGFLGLAWLADIRGPGSGPYLMVAAALAGFLVWNRPPARMFLGDNGSYLLGFLMAVSIMRTSSGGTGVSLVVACLVLGVFALDLAVTVLRRALGRRPLFAGDRNHTYDRLHARGWSIPAIDAAAVAVEVAFVLAAVLIERSGHPGIGIALVALVGVAVVVLAAWANPITDSAPLGG